MRRQYKVKAKRDSAASLLCPCYCLHHGKKWRTLWASIMPKSFTSNNSSKCLHRCERKTRNHYSSSEPNLWLNLHLPQWSETEIFSPDKNTVQEQRWDAEVDHQSFQAVLDWLTAKQAQSRRQPWQLPDHRILSSLYQSTPGLIPRSLQSHRGISWKIK